MLLYCRLITRPIFCSNLECPSNSLQVWSFSPPEDAFAERPLSLPQRLDKQTARALNVDYRKSTLGLPTSDPVEDLGSEDVDMRDAGPSTAPSHNTTFFHDD